MDPQVPNSACPDDDALRAFSFGDLAEGEIDVIRRHLEACAGCEARAEALDRQTDHVLDELRRSLSEVGAGREPDDPLGRTPPVLPEYVVEGPPIGAGGTGLVYKARHVKLDRPAALKMIARRPDVVAPLFEIEARAVALLQHPNIVQIYDIGSHGDRPFLALEFLDGGSLADRMGEPWPPRAAAEMILTVAEAVEYAHRHGVVHCDLKPSNILMTGDGVPKIADFGVAKWTGSDGYWGEEGGRRGTPRYMAPEQAGGPGEVGPATDVYSLGTILYEMLAGRVPHPGAIAAETMRSLREVEPPPPSRIRRGVPHALDRIALRCLHKRPGDRYPDARGLADDLRRFLAGPPPRAREAARRPAALVASALATVALAWFSSGTAPIRPAEPPGGDGAAGRPSESSLRDLAPAVGTEVQDDGSIRLGAASAVIAGASLKFEGSFGNLGYWHDREDRAEWTFLIDPEAAARYMLVLEYANRNGEAGNRYEVVVDGRRFERTALGTEGWSDYRAFTVADVDLATGVHDIEIRPVDPLRGALFDLRAVVLVPVEP